MAEWARFMVWVREHSVPFNTTWVVILATASGLRTHEPRYLIWTVGLAIPMIWRRVAVVGVWYLTLLFFLTQVVWGPPHLVWSDMAVLVGLHTITCYGPPPHRQAGLWLALSLAVLAPTVWYQRTGHSGQLREIVPMATGVLAFWALGTAIRLIDEREASLQQREKLLDVERDQQFALAAAEERARIAREMHDIVAHSLSVMVAQADGGRYAAVADPDAATRALATIGDIGRSALADMRRLLGVLRSDTDDPVHTPLPVTADLDELVATMRNSGLRVSYVRTGTPRHLPPGAGLTVYRICQEALTNVLKHAGPGVTVTVGQFWRPTALDLVITDDGRGAAAAGEPGHGLAGMRERVAAFGGTLVAGPRAGGGFEVKVTIPLPTPAVITTTAETPAPAAGGGK